VVSGDALSPVRGGTGKGSFKEDALLQLGLGLLVRPAGGTRHRDVGSAVENVLAVDGALPQRRPTLSVVVVHVGRVDGGGGNVVLESTEIGEDLGDSRRAVFVH